jgi:cytochrome c oxidase assembly protein subunit 15
LVGWDLRRSQSDVYKFSPRNPARLRLNSGVPSETPKRWLNRFAWFTAAATLFLICSGGMVTSKGVGLAVPDWPTTFGYNMFLFPFSKWVGGIFFEHTHRLIASVVGFLTIILAVGMWLADSRGWMRILGLTAVGAVILQGILGGLRVTMLKDQIGIFHACLAQAFLGLLVVIAVATSRRWFSLTTRYRSDDGLKRLSWIIIATAIVIYVQLALGATMRHQHRDLAILDFPTANGAWIPDTSARAIAAINVWRDANALSDVSPFQIWLQMVHRLGALIVAAGAIAIWSTVRKSNENLPLLRIISNVLVILVICQIGLGAWTIWSNKAADIATAHVAVGATIFGLTVALGLISYRLRYRDAAAGTPLPAAIEVNS